MAQIEIGVLSRSRYPEAMALYDACGYRHGLADRDHVIGATRENVLVGVVRLCREHGTTVLRGMHVLPAHQRQGIGGQLLDACTALLGDSVCYCLPWRRLEPFYARGGFHACALETVPQFLVNRCSTYRSEGHDVVLLGRLPAGIARPPTRSS
jgi:GNAT superfamily N-acetyltransferase